MNTEILDPMERLLAERACERLVVEFVHRLDLGDPGSVADLFTQEGTWEWPAGNRRIAGHDA
ncbi:nuclear transport factor 2 family protein, partial [Streptomyces sp. NPDC059389]|uniref:nuclear transport factor 2 family protein n=1 Tax=Streptomyces sp. NPDC059389 TaxID=3346818 RepID=UPI00369EC948